MRRAPSSVMAFVQPGEPQPLAASLCWVRWSPPTNTVGSGIDDARRPLPWQSTRSGKENECKGEASTMWRQERGYPHLFVSVAVRSSSARRARTCAGEPCNTERYHARLGHKKQARSDQGLDELADTIIIMVERVILSLAWLTSPTRRANRVTCDAIARHLRLTTHVQPQQPTSAA